MAIVVEFALLLSRSPKWWLLPNKSIGLNILAIISGVAFLAFALAVYDGYHRKVERIIFSLTPHIMLRPRLMLSAEESEGRDEKTLCMKVCRAPFSVHVPKKSANDSTPLFDAAKVERITSWLANNAQPGVSASRVLFEEAKLELHSSAFSTGGLRPMRLLGLELAYGNELAPRVDLTFADADVARRFREGAGIIISDVLAEEIAQADGAPVVPGRSKIRIGPASSMLEIAIVGIHHLGIHSISRNLIIAPYDVAAKLMPPTWTTGPSYVGLTLADPAQSRQFVEQLRNALRSEDIAAVTWQSVTDLFDQLELYRWIIFVTLSLSILVTAINTFVNISILMMERAQHIGIMRAMGLTPARLLAVFVVVGLFQTIVGTTLGYGLGISVGYLLDDYINSLVSGFIPITDARIVPDARVYVALLAFVAVISVASCLVAGRRVLKSEITENLRGA